MTPTRSRLPALALLGALALLAGCASASKEYDMIAHVPDKADGRAWAELDDRDSCDKVEVGPAMSNPRPEATLFRVEGRRLVNASGADLEAARSASGGWALACVTEPLPPADAALPRLEIADLRKRAGAIGAPLLIVARFEGESARRRLRATLHDSRDGRVVSTYGPGEPSLALALHALRQPTQPKTP